jgi:hypothetical protein
MSLYTFNEISGVDCIQQWRYCGKGKETCLKAALSMMGRAGLERGSFQ